ARSALDDLVATGQGALGDMRRVLGILHDEVSPGDEGGSGGGAVVSDGGWPEGGGSEGGAPLEPQPGSLDLALLVERFRSAGLPVRTTGLADTGLRELDTSLQLAVYRIVQESLTNSLRHAPGTQPVEVGVHRRAEDVEVVVTDQGATVPADPSPGSRRG